MIRGGQASVLAVIAVTAAFCVGTSEAKSQSVRVTDPSLYWTAYNWYIPDNGSFAQTGNSGAYVKTTFSGSSFGVSFDFSGNPDDRYMTLRYSLDDGPWCDILLPCAPQVVIGSGLNTSTNHSVLIVIRNSRQDVDRWIKPLNYVRILSFEIDGDAKLYPPFIQPKRLLAFWDSIGEGVLTASDQGGDLEDNDSTVTWAFALASALGAELSVVAWGGQGWTKGGGANTPIFNNLVDQSLSGWSNFYFNQTRLVDGYLWPYPDYVVCGHGTNDMWASDQDVYYAANDWLPRIRAASGPSSLIFLVVPFGQYKAAALKQAFDTYQDSDPDPLTYFIDLGPQAAAGINNPGQPSMQAFEGLHPSYRRSPQLGAMLARAIVTSVR